MAISGPEIVSLIKRQIEEFGGDLTLVDVGTVVQVQRVGVTSAVDLDQQEVDRIAQFVSGLINKEVVVSTQVDESILGGVIIQIGDQLLDGSTRSRLEGLRSRLHSDILPARSQRPGGLGGGTKRSLHRALGPTCRTPAGGSDLSGGPGPTRGGPHSPVRFRSD